MPLTHKDVAEIIGQLQNSNMDELVMAVGEVRVEARKRGVASTAPAIAPPTGAAAPAHAATAPSAEPVSGKSQSAVPDGFSSVTSPMVGTFFTRPAPDQPAFVSVGDKVGEGAPVCLVEVMKLFTTLYAPVAGINTEVRAQESSVVEYGQVLFVIEPV